eukprot:TRINITY_DN22885_c0_g1_i1.p1 TRINITY_DN22885_c0_g1~~TRINITY_DN22885_c0_g1_i1.p1  ORF type:complete len:179 (+),score=30.48 TRINITY_DN22885_c0_g1_i1:57-593(+)
MNLAKRYVRRSLLSHQIRWVDASYFNIKTGLVKEVKVHENAAWLYVQDVDVGGDECTRICSGLVGHVNVEDLKGKNIAVMLNLKPREIQGEPSNGMLLCATKDGAVQPLHPPPTPPGTPITFQGIEPTPDPPVLNSKKLKKLLPLLKTDSQGAVHWDGHAMLADGKPVTSTLPDADVS